jgi:flagellar basal body rod protein FlgB
MMGFVISILIVFLAIIVAESATVGKTTSESVLEFPKTDIQDLRSLLFKFRWDDTKINNNNYKMDIQLLHLVRKNAIIDYSADISAKKLEIHYFNGLTSYNETYVEMF